MDARYAVKIEKRKDMRSVKQEQKVLKALQDSCPQVVSLVDAGQLEERYFIVMQLLGANLVEARKACGGRCPLPVLRSVALSSLDALHAVHAAGFIHRDVKPANLALWPPGAGVAQGEWKLIDFGLARRYVDDSGSVLPPRPDASFRGSTTYASLQAHAQQELGRRDDLWSWLYCMVELLDGTLPWRQDALGAAPATPATPAAIGTPAKGEEGPKDTAALRDAARALKQQCLAQPALLTRNVPLPDPFVCISNHLASLTYEDAPDYGLIRQLLLQLPAAGATAPAPQQRHDTHASAAAAAAADGGAARNGQGQQAAHAHGTAPHATTHAMASAPWEGGAPQSPWGHDPMQPMVHHPPASWYQPSTAQPWQQHPQSLHAPVSAALTPLPAAAAMHLIPDTPASPPGAAAGGSGGAHQQQHYQGHEMPRDTPRSPSNDNRGGWAQQQQQQDGAGRECERPPAKRLRTSPGGQQRQQQPEHAATAAPPAVAQQHLGAGATIPPSPPQQQQQQQPLNHPQQHPAAADAAASAAAAAAAAAEREAETQAVARVFEYLEYKKKGLTTPRANELCEGLGSLHPTDALAVVASTLQGAVHNTEPATCNALAQLLTDVSLFARWLAGLAQERFRHAMAPWAPPAAAAGGTPHQQQQQNSGWAQGGRLQAAAQTVQAPPAGSHPPQQQHSGITPTGWSAGGAAHGPAAADGSAPTYSAAGHCAVEATVQGA